jgi:phage tail-like protein
MTIQHGGAAATGQHVNGRGGWLAAQLPPALGRDRVIAGFMRAFEEIADSVREQIADLEYELDINHASPEMLSYVASWLGVEIDAETAASDDPATRDAQRRLIRAVGQALVWRGTRRGVEALLEALTDGRAEVRDAGGVFGPTERLPSADDLVVVELDQTGAMTRHQLAAFLADELPVGARVQLRVRSEGGGDR